LTLKLLWVDFKSSAFAISAIAALIAVAVGFGLFVSLTERALKEGGAKAAERFDLIVGAAQSQTQLTLSVVFLDRFALTPLKGAIYDEIAANPLAEWAAPVAFGDYYKELPVIGTSAALITDGGKRALIAGRMFENEREAVVGAKTRLAIGDRFTPVHGLAEQGGAGGHKGISYRVTGVAEFGDSWDRAIMVPIESIWRVHGLARSFSSYPSAGAIDSTPPVSAVVVKPKTIGGAYELRAAYKKGETQAVFPAETLTKLYGILGDISAALSKIAWAAQAIAGLIAAASAAFYIALKRRHIAVLRAFGADARRIFLLIVFGMGCAAIAATAFGVVLGYAAALFVSQAIASSQGFDAIVCFESRDIAAVLAPFAVLFVALIVSCAFSFRYSASYYLKRAF
jgi:putative ABC transport system permease protein